MCSAGGWALSINKKCPGQSSCEVV
jgi:hypothetical protein